jgi:hypothetical protein
MAMSAATMYSSRKESEVTEELVVTASDELSISRRLVYLLVGNLLTAATGFANGAAS